MYRTKDSLRPNSEEIGEDKTDKQQKTKLKGTRHGRTTLKRGGHDRNKRTNQKIKGDDNS